MGLICYPETSVTDYNLRHATSQKVEGLPYVSNCYTVFFLFERVIVRMDELIFTLENAVFMSVLGVTQNLEVLRTWCSWE